MVGKWTTARVVRVSCAGRTGMMATCRDSETAMLVLRKPYLLYLGDVPSNADAKTAFGLRDWCRDDVLAEWSLPACPVTLGLPRMSPTEAAAAGAGSIAICHVNDPFFWIAADIGKLSPGRALKLVSVGSLLVGLAALLLLGLLRVIT